MWQIVGGDARKWQTVCPCLETGKVVQSVHVNQKIRKLLAIGKRFAVILLPFVDSKYKNLGIRLFLKGING